MTVNGTEVEFIWKESSGYPVEQFSLYLILDFGFILFIIGEGRGGGVWVVYATLALSGYPLEFWACIPTIIIILGIAIFFIMHFMRGVYAP